jgi:hypothetical protein
MLRQSHDPNDWLPIIRAEYIEFPGMHLTRPQIQRLWNLDAQTCDAVVEALEAERFLRRTAANAYVRAE